MGGLISLTTLNAIAFKAHTHPKHRFQNLYGLLNTDSLYQSWGQLNKLANPGIDGITMPMYKAKLIENIDRLGQQLKQKCYRVNDIKRIFIPKSNGKQRPLGLPTKVIRTGIITFYYGWPDKL